MVTSKNFLVWVVVTLVGIVMPLSAVGYTHAQDANLIANPSFEISSNSTAPDNWTFSAWGGTTATSNYMTSGRTGTRSANVQVSAHSGGDAKWIHDFVAVKPSTIYNISVWYQSNVNTELDAAVRLSNGTTQYFYVGSVSASTEWREAKASFSTPQDASSMSIFHILYSIGSLTIDDVSLTRASVTPNPDPPPDPSPDPDSTNLISNGSLEQNNGSKPTGWVFSSWGNNNAVSRYDSTAQDGIRSAYISIGKWRSGDAKWIHSPVTVSEDASYIFSNFYKATSVTQTVLQYRAADGNTSYQWLGNNPASGSWRQSSYRFTVPYNIVSVSVLHVLSGKGALWTDNYKLVLDIPTPPSVSIIENASVETVDANEPSRPAGWFTNSWGTNTASFQYLNTGYDGSRSIKTTITSYGSGDAKWYHQPVGLSPGVNYKFVDYYQSNIDSRVVLALTMNDGTVQYQELASAGASATWQRYQSTFTMPVGAVSVSVFHLISKVGYLITDNYSFSEYTPTPFNRGLLTLTFDDGWEGNRDTAFPMMAGYGYCSTQFYATTFIQNSAVPNTADVIRNINASCHEVHSHSVTHPDLTTLTSAQVQAELVNSKTYLESILGRPVTYFASPFGAYDTAVKNQIMQVYTVHRTVDAGFNSKDNFDLSRLKVQNVLATTTATEISAWITQANAEGTWLILLYHKITANPGPYDTNTNVFAQHLQVIKSSNIPVRTMSQALSELLPQL